MDPIQAALLAVKVPHYDAYTRARQANAARYTAELSSANGIDRPSGDRHVPGHIWNQYTIRVYSRGPAASARDRLKQFLADREIASEIYYPVPLHRQECFAPFLPKEGWRPTNPHPDYPDGVATRLANECLSIPVYPELTLSQQAQVISTIREWEG